MGTFNVAGKSDKGTLTITFHNNMTRIVPLEAISAASGQFVEAYKLRN